MSNCHNCKFKQNIPGNCHISCSLPVFDKIKDSPEISLLSLVGAPFDTGLEVPLGMKSNPYGVNSGWCFFPFNYDPAWLEGDCSQFKKRD